MDNFHAGGTNFHAGCELLLEQNFHAGGENFHAGHELQMKQNFHAGRNFHAGGENFHAGIRAKLHEGHKNFHAGGELEKKQNFHAGQKNFHTGQNFHARGEHFHAGHKNFHAGRNFHAGQDENFHVGGHNFHGGEHFDARQRATSCTANFHSGNSQTGQDPHSDSKSFHSGQDKDSSCDNFHGGSFHAGVHNFRAGNLHSGRHTDLLDGQKFHGGVTNFHLGEHDSSHVDNFHQVDTDTRTKEASWHTGETYQAYLKHVGAIANLTNVPVLETTARFFTRCSTTGTPFNFVQRPADGRFNNLQSEIGDIQVQDIAKQNAEFDLSVHGFSCVPQAFDHIQGRYDYTEPSIVEPNFYPEIEALLLREIPGAMKVVLFDHTVRVQCSERGPVTQVHIDQTPASARARVWRHLSPSMANKVMTEDTRFRIVNVWIPINGKVESNPLAFADSRTVLDSDLVAVEHRYPDWTGETFVVKKNEQQKWYMWGGMTDGDALLLCCYDSAGTGARCAHAAIKDPREVEGAKIRESIEIRALVFG